MKHLITKIAFIILLIGLISSCFTNTMGRRYPKPSVNPYVLSADEQEVNIKIKYLRDIEPYNSQWDDKITESGFPHLKKQIENEWITIYFENTGDKEIRWLQVAVKENLTDKDRSFHLRLKYKPQTTLFTITQKPQE